MTMATMTILNRGKNEKKRKEKNKVFHPKPYMSVCIYSNSMDSQQKGPLERYTDEDLLEACRHRLKPAHADGQESESEVRKRGKSLQNRRRYMKRCA